MPRSVALDRTSEIVSTRFSSEGLKSILDVSRFRDCIAYRGLKIALVIDRIIKFVEANFTFARFALALGTM